MNDPKMICVVDRGDITRSPVAAFFIRQGLLARNLGDQYTVESFRTQGDAPDDPKPPKFPNIRFYEELFPLIEPWLQKHGIDLTRRFSTGITRWHAEKATVLFAMDERTRRSLELMFPWYKDKIHLISEIVDDEREIIDPENITEVQELEAILDGIKRMIDRGFDNILAFAEGRTPMYSEQERKPLIERQ